MLVTMKVVAAMRVVKIMSVVMVVMLEVVLVVVIVVAVVERGCGRRGWLHFTHMQAQPVCQPTGMIELSVLQRQS